MEDIIIKISPTENGDALYPVLIGGEYLVFRSEEDDLGKITEISFSITDHLQQGHFVVKIRYQTEGEHDNRNMTSYREHRVLKDNPFNVLNKVVICITDPGKDGNFMFAAVDYSTWLSKAGLTEA